MSIAIYRKSATFRHLSRVTPGGVVVPPQVSAPKTTLLRALGSIFGAHPWGAVLPLGRCAPGARGPLRSALLRSGLRRPYGPPRWASAASLPPPPSCAPALPLGPLCVSGRGPAGPGLGFDGGCLVDLETTSNPTGLPSATVYGYRGMYGRSAPSDGCGHRSNKKGRAIPDTSSITTPHAPYSVVRISPGTAAMTWHRSWLLRHRYDLRPSVRGLRCPYSGSGGQRRIISSVSAGPRSEAI